MGVPGVNAIKRAWTAAKGAPMAVRARFDAATTHDGNRRHWSAADMLSADAAVSPEVRRTLRARGRYETANNSYARGIVLTLANDTVGTGPRLQMTTGDAEADAAVEGAFASWSESVGLPEKLRTMRMARAESGEVFGILTSNPALASAVKLDVKLIEADQVASPAMGLSSPKRVDGIEFDAAGNPIAYDVLRRHPGDSFATGGGVLGHEFDRVPAEAVIHYFRADRPGQNRGIPDITPALPLFAQLRRYTLATLGAAETAANFAGTLSTDSPAFGEADDVQPMDVIDLEPRAMLTLPAGWKMQQMRAEQPATTYAEFKSEILNEIARVFNMPFNVAAGNSSGYNFASGKLDHQVYFKSIRVEQDVLVRLVLDRLFAAFLDRAVLVSDLLPVRVRSMIAGGRLPSHQWFWDGMGEIDRGKEANADTKLLDRNAITLADIYARRGEDWEVKIRQRAKEKALMTELGVTDTDVAEGLGAGTGDSATAALVDVVREEIEDGKR